MRLFLLGLVLLACQKMFFLIWSYVKCLSRLFHYIKVNCLKYNKHSWRNHLLTSYFLTELISDIRSSFDAIYLLASRVPSLIHFRWDYTPRSISINYKSHSDQSCYLKTGDHCLVLTITLHYRLYLSVIHVHCIMTKPVYAMWKGICVIQDLFSIFNIVKEFMHFHL